MKANQKYILTDFQDYIVVDSLFSRRQSLEDGSVFFRSLLSAIPACYAPTNVNVKLGGGGRGAEQMHII